MHPLDFALAHFLTACKVFVNLNNNLFNLDYACYLIHTEALGTSHTNPVKPGQIIINQSTGTNGAKPAYTVQVCVATCAKVGFVCVGHNSCTFWT